MGARSVCNEYRRTQRNTSEISRSIGEIHEHQSWCHRIYHLVSACSGARAASSSSNATRPKTTFATSAIGRPMLLWWLLRKLPRRVVRTESKPVRRQLQWSVVLKEWRDRCVMAFDTVARSAYHRIHFTASIF